MASPNRAWSTAPNNSPTRRYGPTRTTFHHLDYASPGWEQVLLFRMDSTFLLHALPRRQQIRILTAPCIKLLLRHHLPSANSSYIFEPLSPVPGPHPSPTLFLVLRQVCSGAHLPSPLSHSSFGFSLWARLPTRMTRAPLPPGPFTLWLTRSRAHYSRPDSDPEHSPCLCSSARPIRHHMAGQRTLDAHTIPPSGGSQPPSLWMLTPSLAQANCLAYICLPFQPPNGADFPRLLSASLAHAAPTPMFQSCKSQWDLSPSRLGRSRHPSRTRWTQGSPSASPAGTSRAPRGKPLVAPLAARDLSRGASPAALRLGTRMGFNSPGQPKAAPARRVGRPGASSYSRHGRRVWWLWNLRPGRATRRPTNLFPPPSARGHGPPPQTRAALLKPQPARAAAAHGQSLAPRLPRLGPPSYSSVQTPRLRTSPAHQPLDPPRRQTSIGGPNHFPPSLPTARGHGPTSRTRAPLLKPSPARTAAARGPHQPLQLPRARTLELPSSPNPTAEDQPLNAGAAPALRVHLPGTLLTELVTTLEAAASPARSGTRLGRGITIPPRTRPGHTRAARLELQVLPIGPPAAPAPRWRRPMARASPDSDGPGGWQRPDRTGAHPRRTRLATWTHRASLSLGTHMPSPGRMGPRPAPSQGCVPALERPGTLPHKPPARLSQLGGPPDQGSLPPDHRAYPSCKLMCKRRNSQNDSESPLTRPAPQIQQPSVKGRHGQPKPCLEYCSQQ